MPIVWCNGVPSTCVLRLAARLNVPCGMLVGSLCHDTVGCSRRLYGLWLLMEQPPNKFM